MATAKKEVEVETVKMQDERLVEFAGKRKLLKSSTVTADGKVVVTLDFRNGETRAFTIPDGLLARFAAHGAEQKLGDEIAGLKGADGGEADIDDCVLAIDELIDRLYNGEWSTRKEGSGVGGTSVLIKALLEAYPAKTLADVKAYLKDKSHAEKLALRGIPKLKDIVARLEAEKAAKKPVVDEASLLAGLEG